MSRGLPVLAEGMPAAVVAIKLGYDSVGSFIGLFRKTPGTTPASLAGSLVRTSEPSVSAASLAMAPWKDSFA